MVFTSNKDLRKRDFEQNWSEEEKDENIAFDLPEKENETVEGWIGRRPDSEMPQPREVERTDVHEDEAEAREAAKGESLKERIKRPFSRKKHEDEHERDMKRIEKRGKEQEKRLKELDKDIDEVNAISEKRKARRKSAAYKIASVLSDAGDRVDSISAPKKAGKGRAPADDGFNLEINDFGFGSAADMFGFGGGGKDNMSGDDPFGFAAMAKNAFGGSGRSESEDFGFGGFSLFNDAPARKNMSAPEMFGFNLFNQEGPGGHSEPPLTLGFEHFVRSPGKKGKTRDPFGFSLFNNGGRKSRRGKAPNGIFALEI